MKTTVVATDLTSNANKAVHFAMQLARDRGAKLVIALLHGGHVIDALEDYCD
ncbi:universal stress protein [Salmonirosea aquatica]|uniref:UspA domain-containing protein n=1 Tax=Salmonirosea aquatica TaxID=2654236 RepID=A0A7C9BFB9_9BACT|nr:hypothetical protein [Cytophagaceae bacterium SJW1-29]